jgi:cytochrome P450
MTPVSCNPGAMMHSPIVDQARARAEVEAPSVDGRFRVREMGGLRELHYFKRNVQNYAEAGLDAFREFGDVVRARFPKPYITFFHPRHVKRVLRSGVLNFPKSSDYRFLRPILGNGLFVSDGDLWTRQRKILAPEFRLDAVRRFLPGMVDNVEHLLSQWDRAPRGKPRCVSDDFMNLTLWIVGEAMFQSGFRAEAEIIGRSLEICLGQATLQMLSMGLLQPWMPTPGNLRARLAERRLDRVVREVIARGRHGAAGKHDVLSRLLVARDDTGAPMNEQQIVDEVKSLILAGHETTSLALSWAFYLLARNPEVEDRLHRESAAVLARRGPTAEAIPELEYARRVFLETMRLYPPVPGLSRDIREEEEIDGIRIHPKEMLYISPFVTHRHPACWERPDVFDPDRFAPERADKIVPYSYMPFLLGRRACLGEHFGMLEGTIALAMIASRYKLELATRGPIGTRPISTLRLARPLMMRLVERNPPN